MDRTPRNRKRVSLSLGKRLNKKQHSSSPHNRPRTEHAGNQEVVLNDARNIVEAPSSPSVLCVCSDDSITSTPPNHRKSMNYDDSVDFSPSLVDTSLSPNSIYSQTLITDSPEVDWRWSRRVEDHPKNNYGDKKSITTTKSREDVTKDDVTSHIKSPSKTCGNRREGMRKVLEQKLRRAEKTRATELLKQRCEKLQKQFIEVGLKCAENVEEHRKSDNCQQIKNSTVKSLVFEDPHIACEASDVRASDESNFKLLPKGNTHDVLNDFFNDTDSDCLLLEATQQVETKISLSQQTVNTAATNTNATTSNSVYSVLSQSVPADIVVASTSTTNKENRSSFYMKFLEDETPDDWFLSLDDAVLQVTEAKKARLSLHRYKSLPTSTTTESSAITISDQPTTVQNIDGKSIIASATKDLRIKRHSSINMLGASTANSRKMKQK